MLSYCKNKDDLNLWTYSEGIPNTIIDIGAGDGVTNSNSRLFIENGWDAILIEPQPEKFNILKESATKNVHCLNVAIAKKSGTTEFLINKAMPDHSRIPNKNYYSEKFGHFPVIKTHVESMSLNDLFCRYRKFKNLGILSIDTEGYDEYILAALIKTEVRPHIIICEFHTEETRERQRAILSDYEQIKKISISIIYKWKQ